MKLTKKESVIEILRLIGLVIAIVGIIAFILAGVFILLIT